METWPTTYDPKGNSRVICAMHGGNLADRFECYTGLMVPRMFPGTASAKISRSDKSYPVCHLVVVVNAALSFNFRNS